MAEKPKYKMTREMRAKQFAPFAALRGFEEALREKEKIRVDKKELSEEYCVELNETLKTLYSGSRVNLTFYRNGEYLSMCGALEKFDLNLKYLEIDNVHVTFDDIFKIEKLN